MPGVFAVQEMQPWLRELTEGPPPLAAARALFVSGRCPGSWGELVKPTQGEGKPDAQCLDRERGAGTLGRASGCSSGVTDAGCYLVTQIGFPLRTSHL